MLKNEHSEETSVNLTLFTLESHEEVNQASFSRLPERGLSNDTVSTEPKRSTVKSRIMRTSADHAVKTRELSKRVTSFCGASESVAARKIQNYHPSNVVSRFSDPARVTFPSIDYCKCSKSRCLKLYCDCFQAGQVCTSSCICSSCQNSKSQSQIGGLRFEAIEAILLRRPDAFDYKPRKADEGCKCKKNRCLKKYCDCFNRELPCSSTRCKCEQCQNYINLDEISQGYVPSRKPNVEKKNDNVDNDKLCPSPVSRSQMATKPSTKHSKKRKYKDNVDSGKVCPLSTATNQSTTQPSTTRSNKMKYKNNVEKDKVCPLPTPKKQTATQPLTAHSKKMIYEREPRYIDTNMFTYPIEFSKSFTSSFSSLECISPFLTEAHYNNLDKVITQFCKVPLLSHLCPQSSPRFLDLNLTSSSQPIDLILIRLRIKNRLYTSGRSVFSDIMSIIRNMKEKTNTDHHSLKTAEITRQSFSSASKTEHLVEYFISLWLEFMVPSDSPVFPTMHLDSHSKPLLPNNHHISVNNMFKEASQETPFGIYDDETTVDDTCLDFDDDNRRKCSDFFIYENSSTEVSTASAHKDKKKVKQCKITSHTRQEECSNNMETKTETVLTEMSTSDDKVRPLHLSSNVEMYSEVRCNGRHPFSESAINLGKSFCSDSEKISTSDLSTRKPAEKELKHSVLKANAVKKVRVESMSSRRRTRKGIKKQVMDYHSESNNLDEQTFPEKLHAFVEEVSNKAPHILNWTHDGEAFVIRMTDTARLGPFLTQFFNHSQYSSLQRQLNMYGFKKHTNGRYIGSFHHPCFTREMSLVDCSSFNRIGVPVCRAYARVKRVDGHRRKFSVKKIVKMGSPTRFKVIKKYALSKHITLAPTNRIEAARSKMKAEETKQVVIESELPISTITTKLICLKKNLADNQIYFRDRDKRKQCMSRLDPYISALKEAYQMREEKRFERMKMLALTTYLPQRTLLTLVSIIDSFVKSDFRVDMLDPQLEAIEIGSALAMSRCKKAFDQLIAKLRSMALRNRSLSSTEMKISDYSINQFYGDLMACNQFTSAHPVLDEKVRNRIHRLLGQFTAPLFEISIRGVNQSSVWACAAAVVWATNSPMLPYRPAVVVGVLAPSVKKELWHDVLTKTNESRLSRSVTLSREKLKAIEIVRQEDISCFLVEYIGTHEFSWITENNVQEDFDLSHDPNESSDFLNELPWFLDAKNLASYQKSIDDALQVIEEINSQIIDLSSDADAFLSPN